MPPRGGSALFRPPRGAVCPAGRQGQHQTVTLKQHRDWGPGDRKHWESRKSRQDQLARRNAKMSAALHARLKNAEVVDFISLLTTCLNY